MKTLILKTTIALSFIGALSLSAATPDIPAASGLGEIKLTMRARHETARQPARADATAQTLRTRLGFASVRANGFSFFVEGEHVVAMDSDRYNQAGLNPGGAGKAVIADVEGTELNQLWLGYDHTTSKARLGRQRIVLDNARFVGDVGWRQDQQTYDAAYFSHTAIQDLTLTYGYLDHINRIFAEKRDWKSNSHLFNASYRGLGPGTVTGYGYLLDFDNAAANSTATYGVSFAGKHAIDDATIFLYRGEIATQSDYGNNPVNYHATYAMLEGALKVGVFTAKIGWELLGSDQGQGFKTPLATLHKFNGFADVFLSTPGTGLQDFYTGFAGALTKDLSLAATYHHFTTGSGSTDYGSEIDLVASYQIGPRFTALAKYASYDSDGYAVDTDRLSFELNFSH